MPATQVRITKTKELQKVLDFLKARYEALSEAELCKKFLVEAYAKCRKNDRIVSRQMVSDYYNDDDDLIPKELLMQASHVFGVSSKDDDDVGFADLNNLKPVDFSDYV